MIQINQCRMRPNHSAQDLEQKIANTLKIATDDIEKYQIIRRSIDARKKPDIFYTYTIAVKTSNEASVLRKLHNDQITEYHPVEYVFPSNGPETLKSRPIVVGAGPAGLFCGLWLARAGLCPIILERGFDVDTRKMDVDSFWESGVLKPNSNVLFGEGGAGTFSDGKLNTLVNDKDGRNKEVLRVFAKFGADESILYDNKPHIGTDVLIDIVRNLRNEIKNLGGEIRFNAELTGLESNNGVITGVIINNNQKLDARAVILAIGHSARDTFEALYNSGVEMEQKDFAVGLRVEHLQSLINTQMYGEAKSKVLPPASYKLAMKTKLGRGVYSFCMCPGGYVVNASSESGHLCINGMSYSKRNGMNANSAIVVNVGKEDFGSEHPLAGIWFQRKLEEKAYEVGSGMIPIEFYGNYKAEVLEHEILPSNADNDNLYSYSPCNKGCYTFTNVSGIMPKELNEAFVEGMEYFGHIIKGFNDDYTIVSGIESRTSSPVRIVRGNETFQSLSFRGLYPCGEGAGYAGGITSAAMDGMKVAETIIKKYKRWVKE